MNNSILVGVMIMMTYSAIAQDEQPHQQANDAEIIAVVLGKQIPANQKRRLRGLVLGALFERYAVENKIEPTAEELDAFVRRTEEQEREAILEHEQERARLIKELDDASLSEEERQEKEAELKSMEEILNFSRGMLKRAEARRPMKRMIAQEFVMSWKIKLALYKTYGGRVMFQQAGAEPIDALRDFLKDEEDKGGFRIFGEPANTEFWNYFTNEKQHNFYNKEDGDKAMRTPWWMVEKPKQG